VILLGFLLPLATYLLVLGLVNRRSSPLLVPGVWDFIGLLLAVSGFLLLGGPRILDGLSDRLWLGWLAKPDAGPDTIRRLEFILRAFYFSVIVLSVVVLLWRHRHLTSIYNVDPEQLDEALEDVFATLGLRPLRSGRTLFFRAIPREEPHPAQEDVETGITENRPAVTRSAPTSGPAEPATVLEIDWFVAFRHATLRWEPVDGNVREQVEEELGRTLARSPTEPGEVSFWLILAGLFLLGMALIAGVASMILYLS
jgi:hypothetical protein